MARAAFSHREPFPRVSLLPLTCTVPGHRALPWEEIYIFSLSWNFSPGKTDPDFRPAPSPGKERNWFGLQVELLVEVPKHGILWKCVLYWITPSTMVSPFLLDFLLLKWNCSHTAKHPRDVSESRWIKINYIQKASNFFTQYLKKWISPVMRNLLTTLRRK